MLVAYHGRGGGSSFVHDVITVRFVLESPATWLVRGDYSDADMPRRNAEYGVGVEKSIIAVVFRLVLPLSSCSGPKGLQPALIVIP